MTPDLPEFVVEGPPAGLRERILERACAEGPRPSAPSRRALAAAAVAVFAIGASLPLVPSGERERDGSGSFVKRVRTVALGLRGSFAPREGRDG